MKTLKLTTTETETYKWFKVKELFTWFHIFLLSVCIVYLLNTFILINANVPTGSMLPTIFPNEKIIANRLAYYNSLPERGDIIVFKHPEENILCVKRVIGLPGETVEIKHGQVYINGSIIEELYSYNNISSEDFGPYVIPDKKYFVLGDNRGNSDDSRYWEKYIGTDNILGKVIFKYNFFKTPFIKIL